MLFNLKSFKGAKRMQTSHLAGQKFKFQEINQFVMPTKIVHGVGSLRSLPEELEKLGVTRPWIVSDVGLEKAGIVNQAVEILEQAGVKVGGVFTNVTHTATVTSVDSSVEQLQQTNCDGVIGIGGGSPLVVAKATAIVAGNGGTIRDYDGSGKVKKLPLPIIAIPTTAGSGSEVSQFSPVVDEERQVKITVGGQLCFPRTAILDPNLIRSVPTLQAVYSGVDALTHAIESYVTNLSTPITDALSSYAMGVLMKNLRTSILTDDIEAKEACLVASTIANMACGNAKLGLVHGLARNVQTLFRNVPYGLSIAVFLPPVMEFNAPAAASRFADMARFFGEDTTGLSIREQANLSVRAVKMLLADLNVPTSFTSDQVDTSKIPLMAKMALVGAYGEKLTTKELEEYPTLGYIKSPNIRKATYTDAVRLYEKSMEGWTI
jgi:alcohol dehydrogenase class IV